MHIDFVIFKNVLPALGGEHIFDFYRLSKLRKRHANHNRLHFLRFGVPLEASWGRLEIILGRLGVNLGQTWVNLGQLVAKLGQLEPNLGQLEPTCPRLGADLALT